MHSSESYVTVHDDPVWREGVDALPWSIKEIDGTVLWYSKDGECPHCHHPNGINVTVEEGILGVRGGPALDIGDIYVKCQCRGDEIRPPGVESGCGYAGYVAGPSSE